MSVASQSTVKAKKGALPPRAIKVKRMTTRQMSELHDALVWAEEASRMVGTGMSVYLSAAPKKTKTIIRTLRQNASAALFGPGAEDE